MALNFLNNGYFAGNVGIGTTSTNARLDVVASGIGAEIVSGQSKALILRGGSNSQNIQEWTTTSSYVLAVVNSNGYFGIRTTSPIYPLDVAGTIRATNSAESSYLSGNALIFPDAATTTIGANAVNFNPGTKNLLIGGNTTKWNKLDIIANTFMFSSGGVLNTGELNISSSSMDVDVLLKVEDQINIENLANATIDTDRFLVSDSADSDRVKYRTGAQVRSDIGAGTGTVSGTGTTSNLTLWSDGPNGVLSDAPIKLGTGTGSLIMGAATAASGDYSIATGNTTTASGDYSFAHGHNNSSATGFVAVALGQNTQAGGNSSFASGIGTTASASFSTAMGSGSQATATVATAMGDQTEASGNYSTSMGKDTTATGSTSTAMGFNTLASTIYSTAMGCQTTASGEASTATGYKSVASGAGSFAGAGEVSTVSFGGTASGNNSFAFGYLAKATANGAIAIGSQCEANATNCVTLGNNATSSGINSFAAGLGVTVSGQTSTAFGSNTTASGSFSFACGDNTTASGNNSFAAGKANTASGTGSIVMGGDGTGASTAAGVSSAVFGGELNTANGVNSTILGGQKNSIFVTSQDSSIIGGEDNQLQKGSTNSVVLGGIGLIGGGIHQTTCGVANVSKNNCKFVVGVGTYNSPTNITRENGLEVRDSGQLVLGQYTGTNFNPVVTNSNDLLSVNAAGDVQQSRFLPRGIKVAPDPTTGTIAANVGAIRYRATSNNSYVEMIMQTSAFGYSWVIIKENSWT